jgi:DNA helicase-2/ATP-dependent DNA helicase PcrA
VIPPDFEGDLNPEQLKAVEACNGPCLVLAGAGSGKTRVITYKLAYLIAKRGIAPFHIMAVTFTNKAANEMRTRVNTLIGTDLSRKGLWIGTFHSLCGRILREQIEKLGLGYTSKFTIIDEDDRLRLVRHILDELDLDPKTHRPQRIVYWISSAKSNLVDPEELSDYGDGFLEKATATVYKHYQKQLEQQNLLDFDDLIALVIRLFDARRDVQEYYSSKFEHILVDEYQDVNKVQYTLVKRLAKTHGNITVVGDDDQSIYAFRGADNRLILEFEKDYPGASVVKLEQNYRSSRAIVDAANRLVSHNSSPYPKRLRTENPTGAPVTLRGSTSPEDEARLVASQVSAFACDGLQYSDVAVIYRMNSQSRAIEEAFRETGIPYRLVAEIPFYRRPEVLDALALLRLGLDPSDSLVFEGSARRFRLGLEESDWSDIRQLANDHGMSLFASLSEWVTQASKLNTSDTVTKYVDLIVELGKATASATAAVGLVLASCFLQMSGVSEGGLADSQLRHENLLELKCDADRFDRTAEDPSLRAYLLQIACAQNHDDAQVGVRTGVVLSTAHAAKGLEFDTVFVIGAEEGIFPHRSALGSPGAKGSGKDRKGHFYTYLDVLDYTRVPEDAVAVEEERRLFYVACTRARRRLFISYCAQRIYGNGFGERKPSRFIGEMGLDADASLSAARNTTTTLAPTRTRSEIIDGDAVIHSIFGAGKVLEVFYDGNEQFVVIDFKKVGIKKLAARYAQLKKA